MDLNQYTLGTPHLLAACGVLAEKLEAMQKNKKQKRMEMNGGGGERKRDRESLVWKGREKAAFQKYMHMHK